MKLIQSRSRFSLQNQSKCPAVTPIGNPKKEVLFFRLGYSKEIPMLYSLPNMDPAVYF